MQLERMSQIIIRTFLEGQDALAGLSNSGGQKDRDPVSLPTPPKQHFTTVHVRHPGIQGDPFGELHGDLLLGLVALGTATTTKPERVRKGSQIVRDSRFNIYEWEGDPRMYNRTVPAFSS
jgi:hypothetical protein